jgi:hypothetical protein
MSETFKTVAFLVAVFIGLPLFIIWVRDRISDRLWKRRNPPEKLLADRRAFEVRLLRPDWDFYERHLQRQAPSALRAMYADRNLVTAQGLDIVDDDDFEITISTFEPLDERGLLETRPWLGFDAVAIARSDFGDPIYLRPGPSEPDTVHITFHDGGDTEVLTESVEALLQKVKAANLADRRSGCESDV